MKKCLLVILILAALPIAASADLIQFKSELNRNMNRLLDGCLLLRNGIELNRIVDVAMAVDSLNQDGIALDTLLVKPVDIADLLPKEDCFRFSDDYGIEWYNKHGDDTYLERPSLERNYIPTDICRTLEVRLLPHSRVIYTAKFTGLCHLFMISEPFTRTRLRLDSKTDEINPEYVEKNNLWVATWKMSKANIVTITITNDSDNASTIMLATD